MNRVCVFRVGEQRFGAPTAGVREVVEIHDLAPVPGSPPHLLGVGNLRGRALPVVDLRPVAGLAGSSAPATAGERPLALAVTAHGDTLALAIDEVGGFERVAETGLAPLGAGAPPALVRCAAGRCETRLGPTVLLDLERLWDELRVGRPAAETAARVSMTDGSTTGISTTEASTTKEVES
jgi:purine-binding chemotaxis protein CheW